MPLAHSHPWQPMPMKEEDNNVDQEVRDTARDALIACISAYRDYITHTMPLTTQQGTSNTILKEEEGIIYFVNFARQKRRDILTDHPVFIVPLAPGYLSYCLDIVGLLFCSQLL